MGFVFLLCGTLSVVFVCVIILREALTYMCGHTRTLKLNFRLCPLAEELGLEHSRLCSAVRRAGGRRAGGLCDCSLEQEGGVEERGLAEWRGVGRSEGGIRGKFLTETPQCFLHDC